MDRRNGRSRRRARIVVTIMLALAAAVVGCDDSTSSSVDPVRDAGSPWQAVPFRIPDEALRAAIRSCRPPGGGVIPLASTLVLADVRGGDRIVLLYVGPRVESYTCLAVRLADGTYAMDSTAGGDRRSPEGPLTPAEIRPEPTQTEAAGAANGQSATTVSIATGRIGKAIAGLDVVLASGMTIRTTAANGWYSAWWPTGDQLVGYQVRSRDGSPLGSPVIPSRGA